MACSQLLYADFAIGALQFLVFIGLTIYFVEQRRSFKTKKDTKWTVRVCDFRWYSAARRRHPFTHVVCCDLGVVCAGTSGHHRSSTANVTRGVLVSISFNLPVRTCLQERGFQFLANREFCYSYRRKHGLPPPASEFKPFKVHGFFQFHLLRLHHSITDLPF